MSTLEERTRLVEAHHQLIADTLKKLDERREQFFTPAGILGTAAEDTSRFLESELFAPELRDYVKQVLAHDQNDLAERQRNAIEALKTKQQGQHHLKRQHSMV